LKDLWGALLRHRTVMVVITKHLQLAHHSVRLMSHAGVGAKRKALSKERYEREYFKGG
jgi:hypothetical protein